MKVLFFLFAIVFFIPVGCNKNTDDMNTVKDVQGNVYRVVKIGSQYWTMENLKTTRYNDGTSIPLISNDGSWANSDSPAFCWYDNDSISYKDDYGALYNWLAVKSGKLAPAGWHVASDSDWTVLATFLGGDSIAGGKLKERGTSHWAVPNTGADNASGFTGIPGGYRKKDGGFYEIGQSSNMWSSTSEDLDYARFRGMGYHFKFMSKGYYDKRYGFSVRCVRD
jgi:uncharacterized protein (TIGR02145 family)